LTKRYLQNAETSLKIQTCFWKSAKKYTALQDCLCQAIVCQLCLVCPSNAVFVFTAMLQKILAEVIPKSRLDSRKPNQ
jgi:hypothetical protein